MKAVNYKGSTQVRCQVAQVTQVFTMASNIFGSSDPQMEQDSHRPGVQNLEASRKIFWNICGPQLKTLVFGDVTP